MAKPGRRARAMTSVGRHRWISGLTATAAVALGAVGFVRHARLTVPYLIVVALLVVVVVSADARVRFSTVCLGGLAAWGVLHLAGGLIELDDGRILYNALFTRWIHFDNVVHFIGFGSAGLALAESLQATTGVRMSRTTVWTVTWVGGMGAGAFNEVVEFILTHLLEHTDVGGFENTGRDLVANLMGAATAGLWATRQLDGQPANDRCI